MQKIKKITPVFLIIIFFYVITLLIINRCIENKIRSNIVNSLPEGVSVNDFDLSVSVIKNQLVISDFTLISEKNKPYKDSVYIDYLQVSGFNLGKLFFKNSIQIKNITLINSFAAIYNNQEAAEKTKKASLKKPILVENITFQNVDFRIKDFVNGYVKSSVKQVYSNFDNVSIDSISLNNKIPFNYQNIELATGEVYIRLNDFDNFSIKSTTLKAGNLTADSISLQTIYTKEHLSRYLKSERDYTDLTIPELSIQGFDFGTKDSIVFIDNNKININDASLHVYRDKTVEDDLRIKPLYSKAIRELPFMLTTDSVFVNNATIIYEEKVHSGQSAGKLFFTHLNATITDLSNTYSFGERKTAINVTSEFMKSAKLEVVWLFDTTDLSDSFSFNGHLSGLNASDINYFTRPNIQAEMDGLIKRVYFDIEGNHTLSQIDFTINYDDLKVALVDGKKKRKILSLLSNILVKKDSKSEHGNYREAKSEVVRNTSKSFFNYLWINLEAGLKNTILTVFF